MASDEERPVGDEIGEGGFSREDSPSPPRGALVAELHRLYLQHGDLPTRATVERNSEYTVSAYSERFGSVDEAVETTKLDRVEAATDDVFDYVSRFRRVPTIHTLRGQYDTDYIAIQQVAGGFAPLLETLPRTEQFQQAEPFDRLLLSARAHLERDGDLPAREALISRHDLDERDRELVSSDGALRSRIGGFNHTGNAHLRKPAVQAELVARTKRAILDPDRDVSSPEPALADSSLEVSDITEHFRDWEALVEAAQRSLVRASHGSSSFPDTAEGYLEAVAHLFVDLGYPPRPLEVQRETNLDGPLYLVHFDTYEDVLARLQFPVEIIPAFRSVHNRYDEHNCKRFLESILRVREQLGTRPTTRQYADHSPFSRAYYSRYYDSWETPVEQAEEYADYLDP